MKKIKLIPLCLIAVLAAGLTSCGKEEQKTELGGKEGATASIEKETVEFWMLPLISAEELQAMVDSFNAQSETTEVNLTVLDWGNGREQIKQAVASGSGPDVFYIGAGLDSAYVDGGLLLPLDENGYSEDEIAKYTDLVDANVVDDHLLAAPITYENYVLYYRTDVLEEYGFFEPPTNWDELKSMAKTITEESNGEIMGFQFKGADDQLNAINYSWQTLLSQSGGELVDLNKMESTENSPEAIEALEYMKSFYTEGISKMGTSSNNGFREGKIAMYMFTTGPMTSEGFINDDTMSGKWAIAAPPTGTDNAGGYLGGQSVAVSADSKVPENAVEFVKYFTSPENVPNWLNAFYGVQPFDLEKLTDSERTAIEEVYEETPEYWTAIIESADACTPEFMIQSRYAYTARWDAQKRLIIAALTGEMDIQEALKQIDIEVNQAM